MGRKVKVTAALVATGATVDIWAKPEKNVEKNKKVAKNKRFKSTTYEIGLISFENIKPASTRQRIKPKPGTLPKSYQFS